MLPKALMEKGSHEDPSPSNGSHCSLCYGFHESGPRKGERYPLCLACREEAARLAGVGDPRNLNRAWTVNAVTPAEA